jgi:hypothetical protein
MLRVRESIKRGLVVQPIENVHLGSFTARVTTEIVKKTTNEADRLETSRGASCSAGIYGFPLRNHF